MSIKAIAAVSVAAAASYVTGYVFGRGGALNSPNDTSLCVFGRECPLPQDNLYNLFNVVANVGKYAQKCFTSILEARLAYQLISVAFREAKQISHSILDKLGPHLWPICGIPGGI